LHIEQAVCLAGILKVKAIMLAYISNRYCTLHYQYLKGACHLSKIGNKFSIFVAFKLVLF